MKTRMTLIIMALLAGSIVFADPPRPGTYDQKVPIAYQHSNSPFSASVGICHETDNQDQSQLDQIQKNFKMIHIYRFNEDALRTAKDNNMEVLLGSTPADVKDLQSAVNFVNSIKPYANNIKAICLGNEPNIEGTYIAPSDFSNGAGNIKKALKDAGLNIPITANLVFGCTTSDYPPNQVFFKDYTTAPANRIYSPKPYIETIYKNNSSAPFIFFDIYPHYAAGAAGLDYSLFRKGGGPNDQCCGVFDAQYLSVCNATSAICPSMEVYVGEVGWPNSKDPNGSNANQAAFIKNFYKFWVDGQNGNTIPVFLFYSYPNRDDNKEFALIPNTLIDFSSYKRENGR